MVGGSSPLLVRGNGLLPQVQLSVRGLWIPAFAGMMGCCGRLGDETCFDCGIEADWCGLLAFMGMKGQGRR